MNISAITVKQLRVFDAVARLGSLSRAAEALYVTKAAVSVSLRELENQLGGPVFDRRNNRVVLNAEGARLRPVANEILERMQTLAHLFSDAPLSGRLRIGASVTIGNHILPHLLGAYLRKSPGVEPQVTIANTTHLCQMLADFSLDVAFIEGQTHGAPLAVLPLWRDDLQVIVAPGHPLANGQTHSLAALNGQAWVLREATSGTREQFAIQIEPYLRNWRLMLEFNTNEAIVNAVAAGLGVGFLSERAVADAQAVGRVVGVALQTEHCRSLDLATVENRHQGPLLGDFMQFCQTWTPKPLQKRPLCLS